jgi:hypothetical protein
MTPRPALGTATAALCALLALTACQGSPKAGQPNTTPTSASSTPTPTTTAPSTPTWTPQEQAAITAAKGRYVAARAAVERALRDPRMSSREPLEKAGNGGSWILTAIEQVRFEREQGWYLAGTVKITSIDVLSADLGLAQPEVRLTSCVDSSNAKTLYQATGKPVPLKGAPSKHRRFQSRLVLAPPTNGGQKMWFLIEEKAVGAC